VLRANAETLSYLACTTRQRPTARFRTWSRPRMRVILQREQLTFSCYSFAATSRTKVLPSPLMSVLPAAPAVSAASAVPAVPAVPAVSTVSAVAVVSILSVVSIMPAVTLVAVVALCRMSPRWPSLLPKPHAK